MGGASPRCSHVERPEGVADLKDGFGRGEEADGMDVRGAPRDAVWVVTLCSGSDERALAAKRESQGQGDEPGKGSGLPASGPLV